ncbi:MAG: PrsW family intramembrane metalloprotease [Actinobacteria bacterium]|nr:PrsW family intramembrane metalloprotease [Actinomycetota bacterium]
MNGITTTATPMRLARQPAFWVFLLLLGACFLLVGLEQVAYLSSYPVAWLLSIALLAATAIPAGLIIYRFDQFEPEPAALVGVALLWGGVVALTFASVANSSMLSFLQHVLPAAQVDSWGAAIVAPINEEFYKGMGLIFLYLMAKDEFNSVMDGLVYGAMIGLGFQVIENVQYFMLAAGESGGGQAGPVVSMFFLRVVLSGLYSHMLFTGVMGFGFALFVTQRQRSPAHRLGVLTLCALIAWAAHFVWNSPWLETLMSEGTTAFVLAIVIKGMPFLALVVLLAVFARRRETLAFTRLMATEVGSDVVTEEEFEILRSARRRRQTLRRIKRSRGAAAEAVLRRLMRAQMDLALFRGRVDSMSDSALEAQRDVVRQLRGRLAAIR